MTELFWHFTIDEGTLGYGDGRRVVEGETLSVPPNTKIELCRNGLHSSARVVDALTYAPGLRLWSVSHPSGVVDSSCDKQVGRDRKAEKDYGDVTELVVEFAHWCAARAARGHATYAVYAARAACAASAARASCASSAARAAHAASHAAAAAADASRATMSECEAQERWWRIRLGVEAAPND